VKNDSDFKKNNKNEQGISPLPLVDFTQLEQYVIFRIIPSCPGMVEERRSSSQGLGPFESSM